MPEQRLRSQQKMLEEEAVKVESSGCFHDASLTFPRFSEKARMQTVGKTAPGPPDPLILSHLFLRAICLSEPT